MKNIIVLGARFVCNPILLLITLKKTLCIKPRVKNAGILFFVCFLSFDIQSESTTSNVDAVFRFSITIEANAAQVWPFLFQADKWKYSIRKLEAIKLTDQQEGGITAVYQTGLSDRPSLFIKTQKIVPNKRYGFSIYNSSNEFVGFAAYDLYEKNGKTHLIYDVYTHTELLELSDEQTVIQKRKIIAEMESRQPKELMALKAIVENQNNA